MNRLLSGAFGIAVVAASLTSACAQQVDVSAREIPSRMLLPPANVSPELRKIVSAPIPPNWRDFPKTPAEWKAQVAQSAAAVAVQLPALRAFLKVKSEPTMIEGVRVFMLTPETVPPANRNRLLIHVHGGCYASNPGEAGTGEAIMMAGLGGYRVISVDYRTPPDFPFPAALDDVMTVWKAALKLTDPSHTGVFGSSAGGALTLEMIHKAKIDQLPMPAAIAPGTPMSDLTLSGDSFQTNAMVDNALIAPGASCDARAALYANGHDLRDPLLSPLFGDFHGFPPTILNTGTRDLLLSNTVLVHRKLREAGVEADLIVHEGLAHAGYYRDPSAPETKYAFGEIARFFDRHLGK